jgi:hypothetical protein
MIARLTTALGLVLLAALSILRIARTPAAAPATSPDTVFSAERALRHVAQIAQRPHPMGTDEHDRVRDYIVAQLKSLGLETQIQATTAIGTRYQEAGRVQNVIAVLHGTAANDKAVLLMVHYDGVEAGPAAADDGAGVGALLETLRALRARATPPRNDIIALFTDGEEAGLLGAAAFVREHPRARDVAIALNFEARGTSGRSYMFETGRGNLDAVRMLRTARDVTAGSIFTTIYRTLPNDTDLSELAVLDVPALNFAFANGVERYHTTHDDVAHLNPGSVQHHGLQMLALAKAFAAEPLPRPRTADGVFFDFPVIGLVVYPTWIAVVLAILLIPLPLMMLNERGAARPILLGSAAMVVTVGLCAGLASFVRLTGPAVWSGIFAAALGLAAVGVNIAVYLVLARRYPDRIHEGALLVWAVLGATLSFAIPAVSYPFVWPALFALTAWYSRRLVAEWIAAIVALMMLAGFAYTVSVVMLGVAGAGGMVLVVLVSMLVWLTAPLVARVFENWRVALGVMLPLALVVAFIGKATVKRSGDHPVRTSLTYVQNANDGAAFFGSTGSREPWTRSVLGSVARGPDWTARAGASMQYLYGHEVPNASLEAPVVSLVSDSTIGAARQLTVRVNAPRGTTALVVRVAGASVRRAAIDGRVVDTTRFRDRSRGWTTEYWNVAPEGALFAFTTDAGAPVTLDVAARRPGLPPTIQVPARPDSVVASQSGDVSIVYRSTRF